MRNFFLFILGCMILFSCSPVLQQGVMDKSVENKAINSSPLEQDRVPPKSMDYLRPDEIHWRWGSSKSRTEEKSDDNKVLSDQKETMNTKKVSTNTVEQKIDDKEPPAAHDMAIERPETPELPAPVIQADINKRTAESPIEEGRVTVEKPAVQTKKPDHDNYYVQIGAWKNLGLAETMLKNIKKFYPKAYIIVENNLHKVRVPGGQTKEEGFRISKDIEKKFPIKTFVALNPR